MPAAFLGCEAATEEQKKGHHEHNRGLRPSRRPPWKMTNRTRHRLLKISKVEENSEEKRMSLWKWLRDSFRERRPVECFILLALASWDYFLPLKSLVQYVQVWTVTRSMIYLCLNNLSKHFLIKLAAGKASVFRQTILSSLPQAYWPRHRAERGQLLPGDL